MAGTEKCGSQTDDIADIKAKLRTAAHGNQVYADHTDQSAECGLAGELDAKEYKVQKRNTDRAKRRKECGSRCGGIFDAVGGTDIAAEHENTDKNPRLEKFLIDIAKMPEKYEC